MNTTWHLFLSNVGRNISIRPTLQKQIHAQQTNVYDNLNICLNCSIGKENMTNNTETKMWEIYQGVDMKLAAMFGQGDSIPRQNRGLLYKQTFRNKSNRIRAKPL